MKTLEVCDLGLLAGAEFPAAGTQRWQAGKLVTLLMMGRNIWYTIACDNLESETVCVTF